MQKVGTTGVVTIEEGTSLKTELDVVTGIQFDRSYISPHFVTNRYKGLVEMEDAYILISDKKLSSLNEVLPLLEKVVQAGKPLLIIADDVEAEIMAALVVNKLRGALKVAAVKAPAYGELRKAILQDIAVMTGGTVNSDDLGFKLDTASLDMLGRAKKVVIDKQNTTIAEGAGLKAAIEARIATIKLELERTDLDFDREKLQERLGSLTGGIAVIRVGGATEIEIREKKDRIQNAMHATRAAIEEGILPGGGVALLRASKLAGNLKTENDDQKAGIAIVREAITWPARQIADQCRSRRLGRRRQDSRHQRQWLWLRCADLRVRRYDREGDYRPRQGRALGPSGRGLDRRPPHHHGSHGRRSARTPAARASGPP